MSKEQREKLKARMHQYEDVPFEEHARWATEQFGIPVSPQECFNLMVTG